MKCPKCKRADVWEIKRDKQRKLMGCNCGQAWSIVLEPENAE